MAVVREVREAFAELYRILDMPHSPDREVAMAAAFAAEGWLGWLIERHLLLVAELSGEVS